MLETVISHLNSVDPFWIYVILIFFSFIENIFPPSPSDVVVIAGASLIASTTISFIPVVVLTALASALGFMVMYLIGKYLGEKIVRTGKLRFISPEALKKSERWFGRYGYAFILANRFLPGTRAAISFVSGLLELRPGRTFFCALASALLWNTLIIYAGMALGDNVALIDRYLSAYRNVILLIAGAVLVILIVRHFIIRRGKNRSDVRRDKT
ncbi:MAG: DedA family protein [PVC group bacterium]